MSCSTRPRLVTDCNVLLSTSCISDMLNLDPRLVMVGSSSSSSFRDHQRDLLYGRRNSNDRTLPGLVKLDELKLKAGAKSPRFRSWEVRQLRGSSPLHRSIRQDLSRLAYSTPWRCIFFPRVSCCGVGISGSPMSSNRGSFQPLTS